MVRRGWSSEGLKAVVGIEYAGDAPPGGTNKKNLALTCNNG